MLINVQPIQKEKSRDLYWTKITLSLKDSPVKSTIIAGASKEYFLHSMELKNKETITNEIFDTWINTVVSKWSRLGHEIFSKEVHYDFYANTEEDEAIGINFLITKA